MLQKKGCLQLGYNATAGMLSEASNINRTPFSLAAFPS